MSEYVTKADWVAALRSGKYKQGKERLKANSVDDPNLCEYCCMGVLCEISPEGFEAARDRNTELPQPKYLRYIWPDVDATNISFGLAHLNDDLNWTFNQIADIIEKSVDGSQIVNMRFEKRIL